MTLDTGLHDINITCDFNINASVPQQNIQLKYICQEYGFSQLISEPTYFTETSAFNHFKVKYAGNPSPLDSRNYLFFTKWKMASQNENSITYEYLCRLIPPTVVDTSRYELCNATLIQEPKTRTKLYQNLFLPSALRTWNELPLETQPSESICIFKSPIKRNLPKCQNTFTLVSVNYKFYIHLKRL